MKLKYQSLPFVLFFMFFSTNCYTQISRNSNISNEEIEKLIDENSNNPVKRIELINFYIKKSKVDRNNEALFYAYRYASNTSKYPLNLKYADSALDTGTKSKVKKILLD